MKRRVLKNRFRELLARKEHVEGRSISQQEVADALGCGKNTINVIAQNKMSGYIHRATIEKLLVYFDVDHHEFFETVEEDESPETESPQVAA